MPHVTHHAKARTLEFIKYSKTKNAAPKGAAFFMTMVSTVLTLITTTCKLDRLVLIYARLKSQPTDGGFISSFQC